MLELADAIVLNKSDRRGAADALRDVRKQWRRNHAASGGERRRAAGLPDRRAALERSRARPALRGAAPAAASARSAARRPLRRRLAAAASPGRARRADPGRARPLPGGDRRRRARLPRATASGRPSAPPTPGASRAALRLLGDPPPPRAQAFPDATPGEPAPTARCDPATTPRSPTSIPSCARVARGVAGDACALRRPRRRRYEVRGQAIRVANHAETLARTPLPKVALPRSESWGELARYLRRENLPGSLPVHGRRVSVQARERGSGAHVRGRGDAGAHQPALPPAVRRAAGRAALDGLRQPDALRSRSRIRASTSGARSATPACRSARSTTPRSSTRASTCAIRRPPSR